ncbi:MAG: protein kinase [Burkholderiales bacterium]
MSLAPRTRLGQYEVIGLLGAGGMGEVYRARDSVLGRDVAIKILPTEFAADSERFARFEREARLLAALNHPHIGAIYGFERFGDTRGLILELVDGETLAERLSRGPLSVSEALGSAGEICEALDAAHEAGIVHRDLKPANIKLSTRAGVKVLDFGLALERGERTPDLSQSPTLTRGTRDGVILGTAGYMSPEQARGRPVDRRTDVWAFGCVLFEMLSGRASFARGTLSDTIVAVLEREPDWALLPATTPLAVRRLLARCLEKDPRRRLRDIGDALADVAEAATGGPATGQPAQPEARRRGAVGLLGWGVAAALAAGFAWQLARTKPASSPAARTSRAIPLQLTNLGGTEASAAVSPDGNTFVFVSDHGGTPDIWLRQVSGGDPVRLTNDPAVEGELAYSPEGAAIYFTRTETGAAPDIWRTGSLPGQARAVLKDAQAPVPSPDGQHLAYYAQDGPQRALTVSRIDGSDTRKLAGGIGGGAARPAWSPDGTRVSYAVDRLFAAGELRLVELATGQERTVTGFKVSGERIRSHAWLPDGRHIVAVYEQPGAAQRHDLAVLDLNDGTLARLTLNQSGLILQLSLSADGARLVASVSEMEREVWRVPFGADPDANGRAATRLVDRTRDPMWLFVSRDGRTLLFNSATTGSRNLWMTPADGRSPPAQITTVPGDDVMHSSLSPDGSRVAFVSRAAGTADIFVQDVDGTSLRQLTGDEGADSWPVFTPDGKSIVLTSSRPDGAIETWQVPAAGGRAEKLFDGFFRGDLFARRDGGTLLVTSDGRGRVRLMDFERRSLLWERPAPGTGLSLPMFSADGRLVSQPRNEGRDRDAIWVADVETGTWRVAARFPQPFRIFFRASWGEDGRAFLVNRYQPVSRVVLFDRFWTGGASSN